MIVLLLFRGEGGESFSSKEERNPFLCKEGQGYPSPPRRRIRTSFSAEEKDEDILLRREKDEDILLR